MRDVRKDIEYFDKYIDDQRKRIVNFEKKCNELTDSDKIKKCKMMLAGLYKDMLYAQYSAGESFEEVRATYDKYIGYIEAKKTIAYGELIDVISIGCFLGVSCERYIEIAERCDDKDDLILYLLKREITGKGVLYPYYDKFLSFLHDEISTDEFVNYISDDWYNNSYDFAWYETHKSNNDTYVGYWCWLASACLMIKGISLDTIKCVYIPHT